VLTGLLHGSALTALSGGVALAAAPYVWRSVKVGGGGFIPNVVFSRVRKGLAYLRSDMGGAYRWDASKAKWTPLLDSFAEGSFQGVESVAPDPVDQDVVYLACGMGKRDPAAILRSANRGDDWTVSPVPFRMGGNEDGRGVGERLAIDPNRTSTLYFGSRHDGLQRSLDRGATWSPVESFPRKGLPAPTTGWSTNTGLSFVVFDPQSGRPGEGSGTLFVGCADPDGPHLYRSDDAGRSWAAVSAPTALRPLKAELETGGTLYITFGDGTGPNGVTDGAVFKLDIHSGAWTDITPVKPTGGRGGGFMGISLDRQRPGTLAVSSLNRWRPYDTVWRSTDSGATWADIHDQARRDVSTSPFLLWGKPQADIGWWMAGLAIDPFDSDFACYTTGATIYATHEFTKVGQGQPTHWTPWVEGIEQTAVLTLVSLPEGPHLLSGFGDISGFTHEDLATSPTLQFTHPVFGDTHTLDYAGRAPRIVVRGGTPEVREGGPTLAWSQDFGRSWSPLTAPRPADPPPAPPGTRRGNDPYLEAAIAVSADGSTFMVMLPKPVITRDRGRTWTTTSGLSVGARPVPDRVDASRFYALDFATGNLFLSTDGGQTFAETTTLGLPADIAADRPTWREAAWPLRAVPGHRGGLWFISRQGLYRSRDGGGLFHRVETDLRVEMLDFGPAVGGDKGEPALYAIGRQGETRAVWRSDDGGARWIRLNDARHEYGRRFRCLAADQRVPGRVYVGTDGRGILYGQPG
jgi:photosystem II stability/assembly factor-like uncharacterized protein